MLTYLEQLEFKAKQRGTTLDAAFKLADIPHSTLWRALSQNRDISFKIATKVWEVLECQTIPKSLRSTDTLDSLSSSEPAVSS